jgi:hypothetical protein
MVRSEIDALLAEADPDRHKQRAIAEIVSGLVRGIKHWNGKARQAFWSWLTPCVLSSRLSSPLRADGCGSASHNERQAPAQDRCHHETRHAQGVDDVLRVQLCVAFASRCSLATGLTLPLFAVYKRDPRRLQPLVDFVIQGAKSLDLSIGFAFESA